MFRHSLNSYKLLDSCTGRWPITRKYEWTLARSAGPSADRPHTGPTIPTEFEHLHTAAARRGMITTPLPSGEPQAGQVHRILGLRSDLTPWHWRDEVVAARRISTSFRLRGTFVVVSHDP